MDMCSDDPPRARVLQKSFSAEEKPRPVLVTSEKSNAAQANGKPQTKEITSRYKLGITSAQHSSSPSARQTSPMSKALVSQRAQSAEKKRPSNPSTPSSRRSAPSSPQARPSSPSTPSSKSYVSSSPSLRSSTPPSSPFRKSATPVRDPMAERLTSCRRSLFGRAPDGLWPSMRSLSASFQSDSSILSSKSYKTVRNPSPDRSLKPSADAASERKRTPLRGRNASDQSENSKPVDNSRARVIEQLKWPAMMGGKVSCSAWSSKSLDLTDRVNRSASLPISARGSSPRRRVPLADGLSRKSSSEAAELLSTKEGEKVTHGTILAHSVSSLPSKSAPFDARKSTSPSPITHLIRPSSPKKSVPVSSSYSRGMQSPRQSRPSTPSSLLSSTCGCVQSPSRSRPSSPSSSLNNVKIHAGVSSSVLNYNADVLKGKNTNHLEHAHQLRLLYNRDLQWHFVNARADAAFSTQKLTAEDMLYNVGNITSELRDSVVMKRIDVQNLRLEVQLNAILKEEIAYLEEWSELETEHSTSLLGAIEALKASTLRLPVTGGARADVYAVKNAISSAVDVMQAMGSSVCYLLSRVEGTNSLLSELSQVAYMERAMVNECRELLASVAAMQVQECSLRTNVVQLRQDVLAE